ncbi:nuclear transport factor 2 family protein [Streptomyces roseoverticillatus]|uniref:nuclear transport factor 2 family protein n=1 Tax=Streptomyces roseoverticillatus TaxID=66429 RepID=UPI001F3CFE2A|nr:nuclear transport factor 2 family protein [Streptomyces roseoverticillatus]MCF3102262.1 nuclear transport factor 2 family protein [Streptomyces roseoverticillatus]
MSGSPQIDVVRRFYDAKGDLGVIRAVVAEDARWDVAEGFPNGGVHDGLDRIIGDFFPFLAGFQEFRCVGDAYYEDGDQVIVLGRYIGVTTRGKPVNSRFAHFFTLRDGKIIQLRQTSDTLPIARALQG